MLSQQNPLTGVKVMVIDDSNTIRRSAEIFLLQAGCAVILAEDGFDALAKIADHQPDLVFVDIMMPRLDGYQTCALIKKNAKFHQTPVVMLSSKDGLFDRAEGGGVPRDPSVGVRIAGAHGPLTRRCPFGKPNRSHDHQENTRRRRLADGTACPE